MAIAPARIPNRFALTGAGQNPARIPLCVSPSLRDESLRMRFLLFLRSS